MKKTYLLIVILVFLSPVVFATHIIGGNLRSTQTGSNTLDIKLNVFRDCADGNFPISASYRLYALDALTLDTVLQVNLLRISLDTVELSTLCFVPRNLCIEEYVFGETINLPNNPNGYLLFATTCCRNAAITNIADPQTTGIVWTLEIPDPAIQGGNTSPNLRPYPTDGFLCLNHELDIDFSATDADGDSLSYGLVDPYTTQPSAYPFNTVNWLPGYSAAVPITGSPNITIDPITGLATCKADQLGLYVLAYEVKEYRNGQLIGRTRRDLQIQVIPCAIDLPAQITSPNIDTAIFKLDEQQCFTLAAFDDNPTDTLTLKYTVLSSVNSSSSVAPLSGSITGIGQAETELCWEPNCLDALGNQTFTIEASVASTGCEQDSADTKTFTYKISQPLPEASALLPNVFTPNRDGVGDILKPLDIVEERCASNLTISIFNRWGQLMHTDKLASLAWDGKYLGNLAAEGVYFYVVSGTYMNADPGLRGSVTLIR